MNESFGADGNSCTLPTTWNGTTRNFPLEWSRTRSRSSSPIFNEKSVIVSYETRMPSRVERSRPIDARAEPPRKYESRSCVAFANVEASIP